MKGHKKGKLGVCLTVMSVLTLLLAIGMLAGCKKKETYRNIRITEITGDAVINREEKTGIKASANMNLQSGDELITEKGAKVTLRLDDDKYVVVDEDSKLVLIAEGTAEDSTTRIELEYGAVFSDIKEKLSDKSGYEVVTPGSVMSVRGTKFEVVYREIKDEAGKLIEKVMKVLTFTGEVYVKPEGTNDKRISKAGTMEVLVEAAEGKYEFDGGSKEIETEDLSELSAAYLQKDLSENDSDFSEEEKAWKEELSEIIEEFFEKGLSGKDETSNAADKESLKWNNHVYRFVPLEGRIWEQMNAYCKENGGHLATIMSSEENNYLYDQMVLGGFGCAYFGYSDEETEGEWKWVTGETTTYENWYDVDVDNYREEEYAMIWTTRPYFWNDGGLRESSNAAFICEWDTDGNGNILTPTPGPTPTPRPTSTPHPMGTPTPVPGQETENKELTLEVYLPKVIKPLETYEVSGIEGLYEALEPNTRSITSPDFEEKITLQEEMQVWFNYIADTYVLGEGAIKDAAETVYGKEVVITCEGFYSEDDNDLLYPLDDPRTFEEFGVDDSYLTLYPVYTVHIPGEEVSDRYVPLRLMIEEDEDYNFYTFMVQSGTDLGLPKVEGYDMYWLVGSDKTEEPRQRIEEDRLSWPILQAEKQ